MTFLLRRRRLLTVNLALPTGRLVTLRYTANETVESVAERLHDLLKLSPEERAASLLLGADGGALPLDARLSAYAEHNNATLRLVSRALLRDEPPPALPAVDRSPATRCLAAAAREPHMSYTRRLRTQTDGIIRGDLGKDLANRWGPTRLRPIKLRPRGPLARDAGRNMPRANSYANRKFHYVNTIPAAPFIVDQ